MYRLEDQQKEGGNLAVPNDTGVEAGMRRRKTDLSEQRTTIRRSFRRLSLCVYVCLAPCVSLVLIVFSVDCICMNHVWEGMIVSFV